MVTFTLGLAILVLTGLNVNKDVLRRNSSQDFFRFQYSLCFWRLKHLYIHLSAGCYKFSTLDKTKLVVLAFKVWHLLRIAHLHVQLERYDINAHVTYTNNKNRHTHHKVAPHAVWSDICFDVGNFGWFIRFRSYDNVTKRSDARTFFRSPFLVVVRLQRTWRHTATWTTWQLCRIPGKIIKSAISTSYTDKEHDILLQTTSQCTIV